MIEVLQVSKTFGKKQSEFTALTNINLTVKDGETVAIIGKSGSGKSTLMHVMSGLDRPTEGAIKAHDKTLSTMKAKELDKFRANEMGFIFQSFFVEPRQTCYQNVMLPLEIARVPRRKRRKLVEDALAAVELTDKSDQVAANLSGGQKQRLAIARSIVNKPKLLFADEPTGNLDSVTGNHIMELLFGLNRQLGVTLVIVTHDSDIAARCERQVRIVDGKIVAVDTKATVTGEDK
jgi:putative ABC transport system ATP-binding protein